MDYDKYFDNIIDLIIEMPGGDRDVSDFFEFITEHVKGAKKGKCDGTGGMEFRRSIKEWFEGGKPRPISSYLCGTPQ